MIYDVEQAFIDYFDDNPELIVGSGGQSIDIYRDHFPDDSDLIGVVVDAELREANPTVQEIEGIGLRILVRHTDPKHAFFLIQNIDLILDKKANMVLNSELEICTCYRNAGPDRFGGTPMENYLWYWTALYTCRIRRRA
jgi:hypothetical protein